MWSELQILLDQKSYSSLIWSSGRIFLTLCLLAILWIFFRFLIKKFKGALKQRDGVSLESEKRINTLTGLLHRALQIFLIIFALIMVLGEMGINLGPILAGAGVAGVALGFGAQSLVKDIISGFFLILEDQVRVGDIIKIDEASGLVEKINFRTIVLRDLSGVVHIVPNGSISKIANLTKEWSAYVLDIGVAYKDDVDHVISVIHRVGEDLRADPHFGSKMIEDIEVFGLDSFADSAVVIKARLKTLPRAQWEVGREYRRRLKYVFEKEGIDIPFPQRVVQFSGATNDITKSGMNI